METNPKSTQDFLWAIKTQGDRIMNIDGIKLQIGKNIFPPQSSTSISSQGLLEIAGGVTGKSVLDMGTGSGIQAILAAKAGAATVTAVDISLAAVSCARHNFNINGCKEKINLYQGDLFGSLPFGERFDIIIANLPFLDYPLYGVAEATLYDPDLRLHHRLLCEAGDRMTKGGVMVLPHANLAGNCAFSRLEKIIECYNYRIVSMTEKSANGYIWRVYKLSK